MLNLIYAASSLVSAKHCSLVPASFFNLTMGCQRKLYRFTPFYNILFKCMKL